MKTFLTLIMLTLSSFAYAGDKAETILIETHGLVCDFCARGLEKTLLKHHAVAKVEVNLTEKRVTVHTHAGHEAPTDDALREMVTSAGYTAHTITRQEAGDAE
jgi:cation transport ATPase